MKHNLRWIVVLVVASAISSLATYRVAYLSGYRQGSVAGLTCGEFTESLLLLLPLEKLRAGDVSSATHQMETTCFGRANVFFKYPTPVASQWVKKQGLLQPPSPVMARALAKELWQYRATYRTNSADWDDAERELDVEIAKVKSDDYKAWAGIEITPSVTSP